MKFTTKLGCNTILSDNKALYPIYLLLAVLMFAVQFKYYEVYRPGSLFDGLKISFFLFYFCAAWAPVVLLICIIRFYAVKKFIENGIKVWGHVIDIVRGQLQFNKLGKIAFGYMYLDNSYYKQKQIRFVREFKHIVPGDRIRLIIDPDDPNNFILLGS